MIDDHLSGQGPRALPYLWFFAAAFLGLFVIGGLKLRSDVELIRGAYLYGYTPYTFDQTLQTFAASTGPIEKAAWNALLHGSDLQRS